MKSSNKMEKRVTSSSLKVSKSIEKKQQFNSLINVLKPKVYITDSSRFMKLVQELTGNDASSSPSNSSSSGYSCSSNPAFYPPPLEPVVVEKLAVPVIDLDEQESFSTDDLLSFDSLEQFYLDEQTCSDTLGESLNLAWEANMSFGEMNQSESLFFESQVPVVETEWSAYQDLESWLLDTEQQPFQYHSDNNDFNLDDICSWLL